MLKTITKLAIQIAAITCGLNAGQSSVEAQVTNEMSIVLPFTNWTSANKAAWLVDDVHYQGSLGTNGFGCALWMRNMPYDTSQQPPVCGVTVISQATNGALYWKRFPGSYLKVTLLDATGHAVIRTKEGQTYGVLANASELAQLTAKARDDWVSGRSRTPGFSSALPSPSFSIPALFTLDHAGVYTLKVQMQLVESMDPASDNAKLQITSLPEVVAHIQIRSTDDKQ
ncbi:MAG: hypothetical protein ABSA47_15075 [Verrucomicrobiota bacterium]